ncbi:MAG: phenylalanyl-tRNA synthetase alpha chain, partial [Myxococcota bacterium]
MDLSNMETERSEALVAIEAAADEAGLRELEIGLLGKKGTITALSKAIRSVPNEQKREYGQAANQVKQAVEAGIATRREALRNAGIEAELADSTFDVTLPGIAPSGGTVHPLTQVQDEVEEIFLSMG